MKLSYPLIASTIRWTLLATTFVAAVASNAVTIPNAPLSVQPTAKPMIMLAMGKDHRMFYEAYNDASDIDGDGSLDIRFKPTITLRFVTHTITRKTGPAYLRPHLTQLVL
jgi:type IV pilus assembly protein PilY1